jgi:hypothetical protein
LNTNDPESFPEMGGTHDVRTDAMPFTIEPVLGQVRENSSGVPVNKQTWNVLQEDDSGSHLANDPDRLGPEVSIVSLGLPSTGRRERLAREASRDEIHDATPGSSVEGSRVIPDREQGKHAVSLPTQQEFAAVRVDLDSADWRVSSEDGGE